MDNTHFSFFSSGINEKRVETVIPPVIPSVYSPDEDIDEGLEEWKYSLIGRLDLVKMKFAYAAEALKKQWKTTNSYQMIPLGKGYFIIKLKNEVDMLYIWNVFWQVDTQVLKLKFWEHNFNPAAQKSNYTFVWLNFPG